MENAEPTPGHSEQLSLRNSVRQLGYSVDHAVDNSDHNSLVESIEAGQQLLTKLNEAIIKAMCHYYLANAWAGVRHLTRTSPEDQWSWEQPEMEHEILHLRTAAALARSNGTTGQRLLCPVLTNLGNLLNTVGRFVEAVPCWDSVLDIESRFGMAIGNRGYAFFHYAREHYDHSHSAYLLRAALLDMREALSHGLTPEAHNSFGSLVVHIEANLDAGFVSSPLSDKQPTEMDRAETDYRKWCLRHCLFLNSLNDISAVWSAASDIIMLPSMVVPVGHGPVHLSFFNQLKQEFVSARYLYYQSEISRNPHFSDKEVLQSDTFDYPSYSLAVEQLKCAFRMAYSVLDKIAFFLNDYLKLGIPERQVAFRTMWYARTKQQRVLHPSLAGSRNWPLRGLFWLSKDFSEDRPGFQDVIEPDFRDLVTIRNHLEHKHLKLHQDYWPGRTPTSDTMFPFAVDSLAYSIRRSEFASKTLRLLKTIRAALIYLSLAVCREESRRKNSEMADRKTLDIAFPMWPDEWKR